jgi:hypothetical protein
VSQTISEEDAERTDVFRLSGSTKDEIDCIVRIDAIDIQKSHDVLDCYVTYLFEGLD